MAVLLKLCQHTQAKGKHGESCADVGEDATAACIRAYRSGNIKNAKAKFYRQASKNLNQKIQRAARQRKRQEGKETERRNR